MAIRIAYSEKPSLAMALGEVQTQFSSFVPRLVLCFASTAFDQPELAAGLRKLYPSADTLGCSTAGELVSGRMLKSGLVAMAFDSETIGDVAFAVVPDLSGGGDVAAKARTALESLAGHFGTSPRELDHERLCGLVVVDGLSLAEESLMEAIGDLTDVTFVGGSAGDDLKFAGTDVFANGETHSAAAILALVQPKVGFGFIKTQSFQVLDATLVATKVDEARRAVIEFNGRPALEAYAAAIGQPVERASDCFMRYPLGLVVGDEPYVRSPQRVEGTSIRFFCKVLEGMELRLLESTDIVADTAAALAQAQADGPIAGVVNFHCILRTLELEQKGQTSAYGQVFSDVPMVGFSTYGEEYIGHINQTSTMLVLRES